jgi:hypothetical protein
MDEAPPAELAFRKGLGNSLFASPHVAVDQHAAVAFAKSAFTGEAKSELPSPLRNASWCARSNA